MDKTMQNTDILTSSSLIDPQERLKHLINYSNAIEVDTHIPPARYYRSGLEMVRMANVYYKEGSLESAYVLYLKFMTLFLEKIRTHPDFNTVPVKVKAINQAKLREVLPKAEKLKQQLLQQYKDEYNKYLAELISREPKRGTNSKLTDSTPSEAAGTGPGPSGPFLHVSVPESIDNICYPDPNLPSAPPLDKENFMSPKNGSNIPVIDRSKKPSDIFLPSYNRTDLRTVIVPKRVMSQFELMAQKNTINNVETCGILAGKLEKNRLIVTHMILPKQKGTPDSCNTMNEEELFDFQDQQNLITIGWIHTHPTQTAFLSSVDLHTHCPYQLLMPEAVAVVIAPKYKERVVSKNTVHNVPHPESVITGLIKTAFFMLTPSHGLQFIVTCTKTGFHPHPTDPPLFTIAEHVFIQDDGDLDVLDLRI